MNITYLLSYYPLSNGITTGVLVDVSFNIVDPDICAVALGSVEILFVKSIANAVLLFAANGRAMIVAITVIAAIIVALFSVLSLSYLVPFHP
jgi:hypothetical protein